jgi:hypothetical protein
MAWGLRKKMPCARCDTGCARAEPAESNFGFHKGSEFCTPLKEKFENYCPRQGVVDNNVKVRVKSDGSNVDGSVVLAVKQLARLC